MYKNILIAIDLSGEPEAVLKKGKALADLFAASYRVIYCVEEPISAFGEMDISLPIYTATQLKQEALPHFRKITAAAGINASHISIEIGPITGTILRQAEEQQADLIVIGSHARHGVQLLLGSTANQVLHHMKCDVLAVRI